MPWRPLPRIAFAVAIYPFQPSSPADLPLELGDELYIIEQGGVNGSWFRGYLVAPPSLLAGLTSVKGQTLEARVFSGIFPRNCVEIREYLGDAEGRRALDSVDGALANGINGHQKGIPEDVVKHRQETADILEDFGYTQRSASAATYRSGSVPLTPSSVVARNPNGPKPAAPVPMLKIGDETPTSYEEPLVDEIASCLREWHSTNLHELLLTRQYGVVETMYNVVLDLDLARRQLLHNVLTSKEKSAVRQTTVWNLVRGNKMLTGEVIVRDPTQNGQLLTGDDSAIELTKLQSEMSMFDADPRQTGDSSALRHLLLEIKTIAGSHAGPVTLSLYLSTKADNGTLKPLSETYILEIQSADSFMALAHTSKLKTLFTELCAADVGDGAGVEAQLYLVVMVQSAELPRPSLPYTARTPNSRDGSMNRSPSNMHSVKGSVKGRRSMVWTAKSPRPGQPETIRETPPRSSDSTTNSQVENTTIKDATVIRTVGAGILDVAHIIRQNIDAEQVITIWSPLGDDSEESGTDSEGFDELLRSVLPSSSGRYSKCYQASQLHLHFYPFINSDADALIRNNPTLMHNVTQTRRMGFAAAPAQARSDIYLTISRARFPWPALLNHPQTGQVSVPVNTGFRNLQLTLEVRNANGSRLERCIFASSNSTGHTAWRTTVTDRNASWDQTIRLNIPTEQVPGAHIVMSIADAPEFPFALCWLPLWNQQAFIHDGPHSLLLHAYDKVTSSVDEEGRGAYLNLPWSSLHKNSSVPDESVTGPLSTVHVETNLCSTEYSQDQIILGLINWKKQTGNEVLELLRRVLFVPQIEIVKQLRDVFDALFGILVENSGSEEYEDLILNALVTVLGITHDRRYNLGPLVDHYTENQFNFPFATPCLIRSYLRLLQSYDTPQQSRNLRAAFKVGRHLLKFIINARQQQKLKEEGIGVTKVQPTFNRDLHSIFKSLDALMRNPSPVLVGTKTLVVQHFHTWLPELTNVLPKDEIIMIALSFMDSSKDIKGMLILYKLILIQNYTRLDIFTSGEDRDTLISCCSSWLDPYWGNTGEVSDQYRDQVRLCASIVAEFSKQPTPQLYTFMHKITSSYCAVVLEGVDETEYLSMLYSKSFPFQVKAAERKQRFDEALVELAGLMAALSNIQEPKLPILKLEDLALFVFNSLEAQRSIISCEAYPEDWLSLHIYNHRAAVKNLEILSSILIRSFVPQPDEADLFDMKLWELFFTTLLKVVSSDALALETFPEQKRRAVWKIGGDVREQGAILLRHAWEAIGWETSEDERVKYGLHKLGGYQVQYVPSLVPGIIELCLSVHEGLRRVAVEVLQTMIISEWDLNQDLSIIEMEIVTSLDLIFQSKHMNESITQKLFISELLDLFEKIEDSDEALATDVKGLIGTIDELLELLVACNSGGITESLHTLRLMEFMKDMDREDIFIRYVHELAQTQAAEHNYTQAGLALQFHADLYTWEPTRMVPALANPAYPEQSAFDRKEALYFQIIQHFEDGKAWTHALACYKELIEQYEHIVMDFTKLSRAQGSMAKIYESISKEEKPFPRYFRVCYRGLGFPPTLRDKQFIFEGLPNERMASFTDRMQKLHPAAQFTSSSETEDIEGQFLQISSVSAHREIMHPVYQRSKVPHSVREHLLISVPVQFSYTSKRHTGGSNIKEQWVEKTIFTTAEPFPNILRRSEIVATEVVELTPLQTAIERTWRKTQELHLLEQHAISGDDSSLSNLTEALIQLLDLGAPHSSCVAIYRPFLASDDENDEARQEEDNETEQKPIDPLENALAVALIDHALSIKRCLSLYSRPAHQATQVELLARFEAAFGPEIASLAAYTQTPSPPQSANHSSNRSTPHANGHGSDLAGRSFSPEQELIRTSRSNSERRHTAKPSLSHRISIANPFKRSNHQASASVATVQQSQDLKQLADAQSSCQSINLQDRDDDAVTVHSRATSRGGKSEKRRSWFGGDAKPKQKATPSTIEPTEEQVDQQRRDRSRARSSTNKSTKSHDELSQSRTRQNRLESKKSTPVLPSGGWDSAPTALPRTSQSDHRPNTSEIFGYPDKSLAATVTISAGVSNNQSNSNNVNNNGSSSSSTSGVRDSVKKRFSLLKGINKKTSRANVRDGGNGILAESLREE
ncbi:dedicator of cytokinesis domain protein, putative [Talaromyces stipitatus ATCC 10500]|uniref:Dedicator of cytokinesis domain protein, putative n=1 Tax=Talaromyces stipitatus (strain ATCC 10500 / CBS 375.48 / QM 6759 / NRRL 1006) TaxID=441959 RepID=B8MGK8_TALSN|nr:dedicator of cytokinesis domain protein, putative [Talaromyces stipitatus ATCC 10500]EED16759.1 dedicator of cytokinesis domain protein, putative [Talaromyces stipitatus ATCC 10500]